MTLIELLIAMLLMGIVMIAASKFFISQSKTFRRGVSDAALLQNLRFGADLLNQHFRSVGANTTDGQPAVIFANDHVLSFNADYATNTPGDLNAIYYLPKAPDAEVRAMTAGQQIIVPGQSTLKFPDYDYLAAPSIMSPAEMITFWFAPDTETVRTDDYVLYRQVNNGTPEAVVRNILKDTVPFFRFMYLKDSAYTLSIDTVKSTSLPLEFDLVSDTVRMRLLTNLRAVMVSYLVTNGMTGPSERTRPMMLIAPFPNLRTHSLATCGNSPMVMSAPTIARNPSGIAVDITWSADGDETGGERDIMAYLLWRRQVGATAWGSPFASIAAGNPPTYRYTDTGVPLDPNNQTVWEYAVAAQDCTPNYSAPVMAPVSVTLDAKP
jgi:type II secretory pathway pseudopilin PulG